MKALLPVAGAESEVRKEDAATNNENCRVCRDISGRKCLATVAEGAASQLEHYVSAKITDWDQG